MKQILKGNKARSTQYVMKNSKKKILLDIIIDVVKADLIFPILAGLISLTFRYKVYSIFLSEPIPKIISDFISKGISYYFPDHCSIDYIKIQRAVFEFWDQLNQKSLLLVERNNSDFSRTYPQ